MLFDAQGEDSEPDIAQVDTARLSDQQLLWVDVCGGGERALTDVLERLGLSAHAAAIHAGLQGAPRVENFGEWFLLHAVAIAGDGDAASADDIGSGRGHGGLRHATRQHRKHEPPRAMRIIPQSFTIVTGRNYVLTVHDAPLYFLDALREREQAETQLGVLSAESFTASLLDWQLATYFEAVSTFETAVDSLEVDLLTNDHQRHCLPELAGLRRTVSSLRQQLSPHRNLFAALERPDFRPSEDEVSANQHFHQIGKRFDHAMDAIDNARDLVVGTFELFATRAAQRTNDNMRRLTFATVLIGSLAVLAGILGMNFDVAFFESGAKGFWSAIAGMALIAVVALAVARARDWL